MAEPGDVIKQPDGGGQDHPPGWAADIVQAQTRPPEVPNTQPEQPVSPVVFQAVINDLANNHIATDQLISAARDLNQSLPGEGFNSALFRLFRQHREDAFKEQTDLRAQGREAPLLGQILVKNGWATQEQVDHAMEAQDRMKADPNIPKESVPKVGQIMADQLERNVSHAWQEEWHKFNMDNAHHL